MKPPSRRQLLVMSSAVMASGCFGSFGLTDMLYGWNGRIENRWARALVFLALVIVPVYTLFLVVDALVLNTIEFWTGEHPVGDDDEVRIGGASDQAVEAGAAEAAEGPHASVVCGASRERQLEDGRRVFSQATDDIGLVRHQVFEGDHCVRTVYVHRVGKCEMHLLDGERKLLVRALRGPDGGVEVRDASGNLLSAVNGVRAEHMAQAVAAGRSVGETVYAELTTTRSA
jgi:hypothetical protein